jgi:Zn-dependent peptidase ImmA (M78 family)/DNA-binding XRE family transcriptional regulator
MRGTPGFIGARLREARDVRGVTAVVLSEGIGVSGQTISSYEQGRSSPSAPVLTAIAIELDLPETFFLRPVDDRERGTIFFRSMASASKRQRTRAIRRYGWLRNVVEYVSDFVLLPEPNFPTFDLPEDPLLIDDDDIEAAAQQLREHWTMLDGPVANMVRLVENQGGIVVRDRLGAESLDGLSELVPEARRPHIVIGTDKGTAVRWRFDCAHELGHVVLHSHVSPALLQRAEQFKRLEAQAHRFAGAFLLPFNAFADDLFAANLDAMRAIKPRWKVSIGTMVIRAKDMGLISSDTARSLWIGISRRKWRRAEPFDDAIEIEEPQVLRRAFELILDNGAQTPDDIQAALDLPLDDIESLSGLPVGYLAKHTRVSLRSSPLFTAADSSFDNVITGRFGRTRS